MLRLDDCCSSTCMAGSEKYSRSSRHLRTCPTVTASFTMPPDSPAPVPGQTSFQAALLRVRRGGEPTPCILCGCGRDRQQAARPDRALRRRAAGLRAGDSAAAARPLPLPPAQQARIASLAVHRLAAPATSWPRLSPCLSRVPLLRQPLCAIRRRQRRPARAFSLPIRAASGAAWRGQLCAAPAPPPAAYCGARTRRIKNMPQVPPHCKTPPLTTTAVSCARVRTGLRGKAADAACECKQMPRNLRATACAGTYSRVLRAHITGRAVPH